MDVLAEKIEQITPQGDTSEIIMFADDVLLLSHSANMMQ